MQARVPTPAISRTYVRRKVGDDGEVRYEASIVVAKTGQRLASTRPSYGEAIRSARRKAGIR